MILIKIYDLTNKNLTLKNFLFLLIYLFIIMFGVFRYDVGADYENYFEVFHNIINNYHEYESLDYLFLKLLSNLFSFSEYGYLGLFGAYFIINLSIILYILKKLDILLWGFFTFVTFGFLFDVFNTLRQSIAVAIFLLSIKDIEQKQFFSFFSKIIIASMFHISAIVLIVVYFISKININNMIITIWVLILVMFHFSGLSVTLMQFIFLNIPFYNSYSNTEYFNMFGSLNSGLGFLSKVLFIYLNIILISNKIYRNILVIGITIYIIGFTNLNFDRMTSYFLIVSILTFPLIIKSINKINIKFFIVILMVMYLLVYFYKLSYNNEEIRYQSIFGGEFKNQEFKDRIYPWDDDFVFEKNSK